MAYKRLDPEDFVVSADSVVAPAWSTNIPTLTEMYTSSVQEIGSSGNYYLSIYQTESLQNSAEVQFSIAYGDAQGSGSYLYDPGVPTLSPTRTVYGQFRNLIYGDENAEFIFGSVTQPNFYVISVNRSRYKESLFPGSLNLTLFSGVNSIILTDNSNDVTTTTYCDAGRIYQIVTGSNGYAVASAQANNGATLGQTLSGSYGLFLPDIGTIVLNPAALALPYISGGINLQTPRNSNFDDNTPALLYKSGSGYGMTSGSGAGSSFQILGQETVTSDFIFIRARNAEFNYSVNPSFISGSSGNILYDQFIQNPVTYITGIGLYNDTNNLLATAKLSKPLKKDFTKEALVRVKLDF
jgi:hypothetical protein